MVVKQEQKRGLHVDVLHLHLNIYPDTSQDVQKVPFPAKITEVQSTDFMSKGN